MKRKTTPYNTKLARLCSLFALLLGVYSVSSETQAYPVSKYRNNSDSTAPADNTDSDFSNQDQPKKTKKQTVHNDRDVYATPMSPGSHNLSFGLGQTFLLGKLGDMNNVIRYENALGFQAKYNYGVSDLFAFQSDFGYSSHTNGDLKLWHLSAGMRTNLVYYDRLVPYLNAGLGFYHPSLTLVDRSTVSATVFGLELGGGLDLFLNDRLFFGSSLTYHNMFSSTQNTSKNIPYDVGGAFVTFLINVGFTL
jgi:hypothetical protein